MNKPDLPDWIVEQLPEDFDRHEPHIQQALVRALLGITMQENMLLAIEILRHELGLMAEDERAALWRQRHRQMHDLVHMAGQYSPAMRNTGDRSRA